MKALDSTGHQLNVGDMVRIVGMPDLSGMSAEGMAESEPLFRYLVGKYKTITAFGSYGHAEINFRIKEDDTWSSHMVSLEPQLLRKRRHRTPNSSVRGIPRR